MERTRKYMYIYIWVYVYTQTRFKSMYFHLSILKATSPHLYFQSQSQYHMIHSNFLSVYNRSPLQPLSPAEMPSSVLEQETPSPTPGPGSLLFPSDSVGTESCRKKDRQVGRQHVELLYWLINYDFFWSLEGFIQNLSLKMIYILPFLKCQTA